MPGADRISPRDDLSRSEQVPVPEEVATMPTATALHIPPAPPRDEGAAGTEPARSATRPAYDVAILGTGLGGSMLGAILARSGAKVVLVDAAAHPRFAVGESTIPYTLVALRALAARYDVPEINTIATLKTCTQAIGPSFGRKSHFGFLLHRDGQRQDPSEVTQFNTPKLLHEAHHLFRQDSDAFMFRVALKHGCDARLGHRVEHVELDDGGVWLHAADESLRARYVVDAGGFRSPLADQLGLREDP